MTWAFSLSAECGPDQLEAAHFAEHFADLVWTQGQSHCQTSLVQDFEANWWCRVCPDGLSGTGIDTSASAYAMTELGLWLYRRLRSAPPFRYALVGLEVDEFRTYSELCAELPAASFPGLVITETLVSTPGSLWRPFRPGYLWQPYEGEVYKPLVSSLDLKNQLNELLLLQ